MARDGWPFVIGGLFVTAIGAFLGATGAGAWYILAAAGGVATFFFVFFFRDPARTAPTGNHAIVAPADGRIVSVTTRPDGGVQIDTFLSVFNVHVNRAPTAGRVISTDYRPGRFIAAMKPEAGRQNERQDIVMRNDVGIIRFAQIAGVLARRIVCRVGEGDELKVGDRIGMIRFGSRMEVILPPGFDAAVTVGEKVRAGETVIARYGRQTDDRQEEDARAGLATS
ncbi:MAG: phosphatidylserine decarboxylase [candidate division Zixibacteria bacterium]|nr:phosphatidylserine decarboxylase [candidate division Zixibacteria bacterium]